MFRRTHWNEAIIEVHIKPDGGTLRSFCLVDKLDGWANRSLVKLNRDKYCVLHLGWSNPMCQDRLGTNQLGCTSLAAKNTGTG